MSDSEGQAPVGKGEVDDIETAQATILSPRLSAGAEFLQTSTPSFEMIQPSHVPADAWQELLVPRTCGSNKDDPVTVTAHPQLEFALHGSPAGTEEADPSPEASQIFEPDLASMLQDFSCAQFGKSLPDQTVELSEASSELECSDTPPVEARCDMQLYPVQVAMDCPAHTPMSQWAAARSKARDQDGAAQLPPASGLSEIESLSRGGVGELLFAPTVCGDLAGVQPLAHPTLHPFAREAALFESKDRFHTADGGSISSFRALVCNPPPASDADHASSSVMECQSVVESSTGTKHTLNARRLDDPSYADISPPKSTGISHATYPLGVSSSLFSRLARLSHNVTAVSLEAQAAASKDALRAATAAALEARIHAQSAVASF